MVFQALFLKNPFHSHEQLGEQADRCLRPLPRGGLRHWQWAFGRGSLGFTKTLEESCDLNRGGGDDLHRTG